MSPADLATLSGLADHVSALVVRPPTEEGPPPVTVERMAQPDGGYLWAVRCRGNVMSRSGRWEWEPSPSNRRKDHARRFRFDSLAKAWAGAVKAQAESDQEWAERCARIDAKRALAEGAA